MKNKLFRVETEYRGNPEMHPTLEHCVRVLEQHNQLIVVSCRAILHEFERWSKTLGEKILDIIESSIASKKVIHDFEEEVRLVESHLNNKTSNGVAYITFLVVNQEDFTATWAGGDEVWMFVDNVFVYRTRGHRHEYAEHIFTHGFGSTYQDSIPESIQQYWPQNASNISLILMSDSMVESVSMKEIAELGAGSNASKILDQHSFGDEHAYIVTVHIKE